MRRIKIAIVGSEENKWSEEQKERAKEVIEKIFRDYLDVGYDVVLISGGCPKGGVDVWAEEIADRMGIKKRIFRPEKNGWYYYRKRNVKIARSCDVIYDIEPKGKRSGGTWTLGFARKIGKHGELIEID